MNALLLERSSGSLGPNEFARIQTTWLLRSFSAAPRLRFGGGERAASDSSTTTAAAGSSGAAGNGNGGDAPRASLWAHQAGVSALALERFDGRILISGGSDATIKIWDLEQCPNPQQPHTHRPAAVVPRAPEPTSSTAAGHRFGITHLSFYPFDSAAFLSSSHDQTLKLWSTARATPSGTFHLNSRIHTHATSPIASHLLVACGTQHPAVRLVDLRSAAAVHSLLSPGQLGGAAGAALSVAWSPAHEHVLAAGSADGAVRLWDVRKSNGLVALLDQEDIVGLSDGGGETPTPTSTPRLTARAHAGAVNGLAWTDDGAYLVSAGHDCKIRVWDAATGANTLASFGPGIRNGGGYHMGAVSMFVSPVGLTPPGRELLFFANETEVLVAELHEGTVVARLRGPGMGRGVAAVGTGGGGVRGVRNRVTSVVWRGAGGGGGSSGVAMGGSNAAGGVFSGHGDGQIRAWVPQLEGADDEADDGSYTGDTAEVKTKKRKALDDAFRTLMGRQVTFS